MLLAQKGLEVFIDLQQPLLESLGVGKVPDVIYDKILDILLAFIGVNIKNVLDRAKFISVIVNVVIIE